MQTFAAIIKTLREENNLPLRKVAAFLDIDQAVLSKYEHGGRLPKREQVIMLAKYFKTDEKELLTNWLAEKLLAELEGEEIAPEALQLAKKRLNGNPVPFNKEQPEITGHSKQPEFNRHLKLSESLTRQSLQWGTRLPSFMELADTLFTSLTGEKFNERQVNTITGFIGESKTYEVYLFYKPKEEWLKHNALTLNQIQELPKFAGKKRLICASLKYVNDDTCKLHQVEFCKIPY